VGAAPTSAARKLFGTDGVRGVAGEFLTADLALALARAATARITTDHAPRVLIIRDTRESGEMLEAAVAARASASASSALRNSPATPRTPSVPNSLRIGAGPAVAELTPSAWRTAAAYGPS
jgi:phosphomannomutase